MKITLSAPCPRRVEDASTPRWLRIPSPLSRAELLWSFTRRSMAAAVVGGLVTQFDVVVACKLQKMMLQPLCICSLQNSCTCRHLWSSLAQCSFWPRGMCLDAAMNEHERLERGSNPRQVDVHGRWLWRSSRISRRAARGVGFVVLDQISVVLDSGPI